MLEEMIFVIDWPFGEVKKKNKPHNTVCILL